MSAREAQGEAHRGLADRGPGPAERQPQQQAAAVSGGKRSPSFGGVSAWGGQLTQRALYVREHRWLSAACPPSVPAPLPLQVFKNFKSPGASLRSLFRSSKHQRLPDGDPMEQDGAGR